MRRLATAVAVALIATALPHAQSRTRVVVLGTGLAMLPNRRAALVLRPVTQKSWGDAGVEGGHAVGAVAHRAVRPSDGHD